MSRASKASIFEDEDDEGGDQDDSQCPERPVTEAHMVAFFGAIGKYSFAWTFSDLGPALNMPATGRQKKGKVGSVLGGCWVNNFPEEVSFSHLSSDN